MSVDPSLRAYEEYLSTIPPRVQEEWIRYYGVEFVLEHIGEARMFEMADPKPSRNRAKFITSWLINARKEEKKFSAQAEEMRLKRIEAEEMNQNREFA